MKTFIIALALVCVAASPALAKKDQKQQQQQQMTDNPSDASGYEAYASVPAHKSPTAKSQAVYLNGEYLGADPDPFIRMQLVRDPPQLLQSGQ
jgi:hypothetical protein